MPEPEKTGKLPLLVDAAPSDYRDLGMTQVGSLFFCGLLIYFRLDTTSTKSCQYLVHSENLSRRGVHHPADKQFEAPPTYRPIYLPTCLRVYHRQRLRRSEY